MVGGRNVGNKYFLAFGRSKRTFLKHFFTNRTQRLTIALALQFVGDAKGGVHLEHGCDSEGQFPLIGA